MLDSRLVSVKKVAPIDSSVAPRYETIIFGVSMSVADQRLLFLPCIKLSNNRCGGSVDLKMRNMIISNVESREVAVMDEFNLPSTTATILMATVS
ncbi:hypothetical protein FRC19_004801 [Serendipita sp. 401]|nr:hypothetical protein FRC19_004801 [Serendipita sp. 401]KAG8831729.1 hypothetical protein FRC18_006108 [Serendipita sp. 400]